MSPTAVEDAVEARWRAYARGRGLLPIEVLAEVIRRWPACGGVSIPSHPVGRPNRLGELDERQAELRDQIVAACDALTSE